MTDTNGSHAVERAARIVLRPIGNPLPLGFLALAGGTLVVSGLQLEWLRPADGDQVALILIAFVFPLQLIASVFGYLGRDVVAGTGMGVLAGTWLSIALIQLTGRAGATSDPLGLLLVLAAVAMLVPAAASATGKLVPAAVLVTTSVRFATTGLYELTESSAWKTVAGVVGLVLCGLAVYAAAAMAFEDATRTTVLPLGRRRLGAESVGGNLDEQLERVEREAGVREQL
jgi:succinate-acetate transporter protein